MFRVRNMWLVPAFLALITGCQPVDSFNPLYQDKDVIFDPGLLGKWIENGGTLDFKKSGDSAYEIIFGDDSTPPEQMLLDGRLVDLQGRRFLDVTPKKWVSDPGSFPLTIESGRSGPRVTPRLTHADTGAYIEFWPATTAPAEMRLRLAHWFFRVSNDGKNLNLEYIDDDRLGEALAHKTAEIGHIMVGAPPKPGETDSRHLLLTASSADLQRFVVDHVNDNQMFADSIKFTKSGQ